MKIDEALKEMRSGKRIRRADWKKEIYIYADKNGEFKTCLGDTLVLNVFNIYEEWEVCDSDKDSEETYIMDKVEKLIDEKIEISKKEIYKKVNDWIDQIW